jgi:hypothetical protein
MSTGSDVGRALPTRLVASTNAAEAASATSAEWASPGLLSDWPATAIASAAAILPALLLAQYSMGISLAAATAIAIALAIWTGRTSATPLVLSLVPATILANSGLLPAATYFVPTAILGLALVLRQLIWSARSRVIPALPSRPLVAFAILYIAAAVVSTIFSIRATTSLSYLVGIAIILIVTLWLGPWTLAGSGRITSLFALIGAAGVVVTAFSLLFTLTGPVLWFGRWLGVYLVDELTISGHPTGIAMLRTMGPYLAPGVQALTLVPAILALLAIRPGLGNRGRLLTGLGLVILVAGLLSTFARAGWLAIIVGSALLALRHLPRRRVDTAAGAVFVVVGVAFGALYLNVIGADYRPDLTVARIPLAAQVQANNPEDGGALDVLPGIPDAVTPGGPTGSDGSPTRIPNRGGSELSGRLEIWSASVRAIRDSPWVGYGPGTIAVALDPYLTGESRRFVGLTSHNTWLRTWLELGVLGILGFAGFVLATVYSGVRGRSENAQQRSIRLGALAIFVGLIAAQAFETFLLGGVSMPSFVWSMAAGLLAMRMTGSEMVEAEAR